MMETPSTDCLALSPIGGQRGKAMLTVYRGIDNGNTVLSSAASASTTLMPGNPLGSKVLTSTMIGNRPGRIGGVKVQYPFLTVEALYQPDKNAALVDTLNILQMYRVVQAEKDGLKKGSSLMNSKDSKRKDERSEFYNSNFKFTKEMFNGVNTQACLQVLRLLFDCYDGKEAEVRMRDVWPVFDKNIEGAFRRVALKWIKEIMECHPEYFIGIKVEGVGGLLVNPGGDRYLQLISGFSQLTMYLICCADGSSSVLKKPAAFNDSEITNRQILVLGKHTNQLVSDALHIRKDSGRTCVKFENHMRKLASRSVEFRRKHSEMADTAEKLMNKIDPPDEFNVDVNATRPMCNTLQPIMGEFTSNSGLFAHFLLTKESDKARQIFLSLDEKLIKLKRFRHILSMDRTSPRVLEGSKLFFYPDPSRKKSIESFLVSVYYIYQELIQSKHLNAPISTEFYRSFKAAEVKYQWLKDISEKYTGDKDWDLQKVRTNLYQQLLLMNEKLLNFNWSTILKYDVPVIPLLSPAITPRNSNILKRTGYTPGLLNFLNSKNSLLGNTSAIVCSDTFPSIIHRSKEICSEISTKVKSSNKDIPSIAIKDCADKSENPIPTITFVQHKNVSIIESSLSVSVHDELTSSKSDSTELDSSMQCRIALIIESLNEISESSSSSTSADTFMESSVVETAQIDESKIGRLNLSNITSISVLSAKDRTDLDSSLLDGWNDEKGIMDESFGDLDVSENESNIP